MPIEVYLSYHEIFSIDISVAVVGRYTVLKVPTQVSLASNPGLGLIPPKRHSGEQRPSALMVFKCRQGTEFRFNRQHEPISPALHGPQTWRNQHSVEAVLVTHQQLRAHSRCHDPFATNQLVTINYFSLALTSYIFRPPCNTCPPDKVSRHFPDSDLGNTITHSRVFLLTLHWNTPQTLK